MFTVPVSAITAGNLWGGEDFKDSAYPRCSLVSMERVSESAYSVKCAWHREC